MDLGDERVVSRYINKFSIYRENKGWKDKVGFKESDSGCSLGPIVKSKIFKLFLLQGIWTRGDLNMMGFLIRLRHIDGRICPF